MTTNNSKYIRLKNYEWMVYRENAEEPILVKCENGPGTHVHSGEKSVYRTPKGVDTYLYPKSGLYVSSNFSLISAASFCQEFADRKRKNEFNDKNIVHWSEVASSFGKHHYFINIFNPTLLNDLMFGTYQTQEWASKIHNFVPNLYTWNKDKNILEIYDKSLCLNQGIGCGNALCSPSEIVYVYMHFLFGKVKPFTKHFIETYIFNNISNNEIDHNTIRDEFIGGDMNYTSGSMNFNNYTTYETDANGKKFILPKNIIGHYGASYGAETCTLMSTSLDETSYVVVACSCFENHPEISQEITFRILEYLLIYGVNYDDWEERIKEKISMGVSKLDYSIFSNIETKNAYLSVSWMICGIHENNIQKNKVNNFTLEFNAYTDFNNLNFLKKNYDTDYKYGWGSNVSKFLTSINGMCMAWYLTYGNVNMTPKILPSEKAAESIKMWDCIDMPVYYLLTNNVTDYSILDIKQPIHITNNLNGNLKPQGSNPIGLQTMYDELFKDPHDSSKSATNYNQLTLKKLMYMQSYICDFDGGDGSSPSAYNSACICKASNVSYNIDTYKNNPLFLPHADQGDNNGGQIPVYTTPFLASPYNTCSWINNNYNNLPLCHINKDGWWVASTEQLKIPYGPMQWLNMSVYGPSKSKELLGTNNSLLVNGKQGFFKPRSSLIKKIKKSTTQNNTFKENYSFIWKGGE